MSTPRETVLTFHDHFNAGRVDDVLAMASDDIVVGGGRGSGNGRQLLNEWIGRKTTTLTPQRWFEKDDLVVIEERVEWHSRGGDRVTDSTVWGMSFVVEDGKITRIGRYADVGEAVTTNGLYEADEVAGA